MLPYVVMQMLGIDFRILKLNRVVRFGFSWLFFISEKLSFFKAIMNESVFYLKIEFKNQNTAYHRDIGT